MPDQWTAKLDLYLDGELAADEVKSLDAHLRACPDCLSDIAARLQLRRAMQSAGRRYTPDPAFKQRVLQQVAARRPPAAWRAWLAAATAAVLLCVALLVGLNLRRQQWARAQTYSELADLHVSALASSNPVDVVSTDRHTVKPWFEGKIPFAFNLPELQNTEFTLLGGRVVYLGQAPGAQLVYRAGKHQVSVFIAQEERVGRALPADSGVQKRASFTVESWREGGLRYFVIGDTGADEIDKLADLFKKAAQS